MQARMDRVQHRLHHRLHQAGVTLIEVAVALAVFVILATVAVPPISKHMQRQRLSLAAETLAADVAEGRFEAARLGKAVTVAAHTNHEWLWTLSTPASGATPLRQVGHGAHPGVRLVGGQGVTLLPTGFSAANTVAVFESPRGERLRVATGPTGRARVCSETAAWGRYSAC
jgi:prepilin-type N-terminal cleavage/methylation domain-containing protein